MDRREGESVGSSIGENNERESAEGRWQAHRVRGKPMKGGKGDSAKGGFDAADQENWALWVVMMTEVSDRAAAAIAGDGGRGEEEGPGRSRSEDGRPREARARRRGIYLHPGPSPCGFPTSPHSSPSGFVHRSSARPVSCLWPRKHPRTERPPHTRLKPRAKLQSAALGSGPRAVSSCLV